MSERRFGFVADESDRAVLQRLCDIAELAEKRARPCFSAFLNEHEQAVAQQNRLGLPGDELRFFAGGFDDAQRRVFCALPMGFYTDSLDEDDYPFCAVTMIIPKGYSVTHRDILGSLMALKIKRESVGDILVGEGIAVVFLLRPAAKLVIDELTTIGRVGIKCSLGAPEVLPAAYKTEDHVGVVASMRLDAVLAMLINVGRSQSAKMITQGLVQQNAQVITSVSKEVLAGDKISVRGFGKFLIDDIGGQTRKGRLHIAYKRFI
ncbi:MAG: hypothetical protein J6A76_03455 [Oscillospiraceae bacterium]|nr:hypothetical protein [Oscillospiraceae bacterium]